MNPLSPTIAADIDRHHAAARESANIAVNHAMEAGKLLLQAKGSMGHGEWLPWLAANVKVSPRQIQRYIAVAQDKTPTIRDLAKNDTASHLPSQATVAHALSVGRRSTVAPPDWTPRPTFTPEPGRWYWSSPQGKEQRTYVVEPSSDNPGFWFVSRLHAGGDEYDCTRRPVRADWVEENLLIFGLDNAAEIEWLTGSSAGVRIAMETLNDEETVQAQLAHKETIPQAIERMKATASCMGASA